MKRRHHSMKVAATQIKREVEVVTLSPDASPPPTRPPTPPPCTSRSERNQLLPKRPRAVPEYIPPIPNAVRVPPVTEAKVRLDGTMHFQIHQAACVCNQRAPPGMPIVCRCMIAGPMPHVRIPTVSQQFELMDNKWVFTLGEMLWTPVINQNMRTQIFIYPLEGELLGFQRIDINGTLSIYAPSASTHKIYDFQVEMSYSRSRDQYMLPLERVHLNSLCPQPMASPNFPYPSTLSFALELNAVVVNHQNVEPRFTLNFSENKTLCNFVIMCGNKPLFIDHNYMAHYSQYFETLSRYANEDNGMVKKHSTYNLPMVQMEEEDHQVWERILLFCSPCRVNIPNNVLLDALRLADQYQLFTVKQECEFQMIHMLRQRGPREFTEMESLAIADRFQLNRLKETVAQSLFPISPGPTPMNQMLHFCHTITQDPHYGMLSVELKAWLMDRLRESAPRRGPAHPALPNPTGS